MQEELIAQRYEAVTEALRNRSPAEVSGPVRITSLPLLSQELYFRRAIEEFIRKVLAAAQAYLDELAAELGPAQEAAKSRLRDAGYVDPVDGEGNPCTWTFRMVGRHPIVQAVTQKRTAAEAFIGKHEAIRRHNLRWAEELTAKLGRMRAGHASAREVEDGSLVVQPS